jgi:hypothetical protein
MEQFVYIDAIITIITLVLSTGILTWIIRLKKSTGRRDFRKGLAWVVPLVVISLIDVVICAAIIVMLPGSPSGIDASDGLYLHKVVIKWKPAAGAKTYSVLRASGPEGRYTEIARNISETSYVDTSVSPGKYYYKVVAENDIGRGMRSAPDPGNPSISDFEFFRLYQATERSAVGKLKKLGGLGQETETGAAGGSFEYNARFDGRARVTSRYSNYADFGAGRAGHLVLNGSFVADTNILGNGTVTGTVNVTGNYSGTVQYDLVISNKKKAGGSYMVKQAGSKSATAIPWNFQ